MKGQGWRVILT